MIKMPAISPRYKHTAVTPSKTFKENSLAFLVLSAPMIFLSTFLQAPLVIYSVNIYISSTSRQTLCFRYKTEHCTTISPGAYSLEYLTHQVHWSVACRIDFTAGNASAV